MKETLSVNIGGRLFNLDSEAYSSLENYLKQLKKHFGLNNPDTEEIIEDIESRIAEILENKLNNDKQVITQADIEEVINIMGKPEDYSSEETQEEMNQEKQEKHSTSERKLFRDGEKSVLGGVCSGLAAYFGIEVLWVRIAFVVTFFLQGFGLLAYVILWLVLPQAKSTSDRLKMKGKPVNVDNIQKTVKEEFTRVKDSVSHIGNSQSMERLRDTLIDILQVFANIFKYILKFVLYIIGISLIIAVIAMLIAFILVVVQSDFFTSFPFWPDVHYAWPNLPNLSIAAVCIAILILIPVIGVIVGLVKLLFGIKSTNNYLRNTGITAWVLALIVLLFVLINNHDKAPFKTSELNTYNLKYPEKNTLYIELKNKELHHIRSYTFFHYNYLYSEDEDLVYGKPALSIERSYNDSLSIYVKLNSYVYHNDYSDDDNFNYSWNLSDSLLLLDEYYSIDADDAWQLPDAEIIIKIPEGQKICINREMQENLVAVDSEYPMWENTIMQCPLIMTNKGLIKTE